MTTNNLHIIGISDPQYIKDKMLNYSYAFHFLYKKIEESADINLINYVKARFNLTDIEYRSLVSDVTSFVKREQAAINKRIKQIKELTASLDDIKNKHKYFKTKRKIAKLKRGLNSQSVFGGKVLLQEISKEYNKANPNYQRLDKLKTQYRKNRIIPFFLIGEANRKGNRFVDISNIGNGIIVYKPKHGTKIQIQIKIPRNWKNNLIELAELAKNKEMPFSIRISETDICLTYDEEKLNGFGLDESSRRLDVKTIKAQGYSKEVEKLKIKEIYKEYYNKQRENKLKGKIARRCIAIDMNPTNIGYSIVDKTNDGIKVISCGMIDLTKLSVKLGVNSSDPKQIKLNNKRKYEIYQVVKHLFKLAIHYKCSKFIIEDLNLNNNRNLNTESNRKIKNVWLRGAITNSITHRCNENGIELVEINPCYTSFIGNIKYNYIDSTNASIEIARRGLYKYENGKYYPLIDGKDISTMEAKFGDDEIYKTTVNWVEIFKSLRTKYESVEFGCRLRAALSMVKRPYDVFSISSYKSKAKIIIFN